MNESSPGPARNLREALVTQALGDLDALLTRIEALPPMVASAEAQLAGTARALDGASERYRTAVKAYTDQARVELGTFLQQKAGEVAAQTVEQERAALQAIAREAFRLHAADEAVSLAKALQEAGRGVRKGLWLNALQHTVTAAIAAVTATTLALIVFR